MEYLEICTARPFQNISKWHETKFEGRKVKCLTFWFKRVKFF